MTKSTFIKNFPIVPPIRLSLKSKGKQTNEIENYSTVNPLSEQKQGSLILGWVKGSRANQQRKERLFLIHLNNWI